MFDQSKVKEYIKGNTYGHERALYALRDAIVSECIFEGEEDGESAFKEARNIKAESCRFALRYPLWHTKDFIVCGSIMQDTVRAPLWYASNGEIDNTEILGVKCLRECDNIKMTGCKVTSAEFGWRCRDLVFENCDMQSEYYLFESRNIRINDIKMRGKYSFQYTENCVIENSILDTKDAFWHAENVTVRNCTVKGEYLGWYSKNLTLINCKISGTQPFCYCENLKIIDCEVENADLAFEYSDVQADMRGHLISVKNPRSGKICADSIGEIILEDSVMDCNCEIIQKN